MHLGIDDCVEGSLDIQTTDVGRRTMGLVILIPMRGEKCKMINFFLFFIISCQIFGSFLRISAAMAEPGRFQCCFALTGFLVEFQDHNAGCYQFIALRCSFIILTKRATLVDIY